LNKKPYAAHCNMLFGITLAFITLLYYFTTYYSSEIFTL
jgi:hypothetical protein